MRSIVLFIVIGICYSTGATSFDCTYSCVRGSCSLRHEKGGSTLKCENKYVDGSWAYVWQCYDVFGYPTIGYPYHGHIKQCNVTGCNPPWGCSLSSFTIAQDTCKYSDSFCGSEYKVCCENDGMCEPEYNKCTPSMTLRSNTTITTKPPVTISPSGNLNRPLTIGLGVGAIVLLLGLGVTIGVIINRRRRHFVAL